MSPVEDLVAVMLDLSQGPTTATLELSPEASVELRLALKRGENREALDALVLGRAAHMEVVEGLPEPGWRIVW